MSLLWGNFVLCWWNSWTRLRKEFSWVLWRLSVRNKGVSSAVWHCYYQHRTCHGERWMAQQSRWFEDRRPLFVSSFLTLSICFFYSFQIHFINFYKQQCHTCAGCSFSNVIILCFFCLCDNKLNIFGLIKQDIWRCQLSMGEMIKGIWWHFMDKTA